MLPNFFENYKINYLNGQYYEPSYYNIFFKQWVLFVFKNKQKKTVEYRPLIVTLAEFR